MTVILKDNKSINYKRSLMRWSLIHWFIKIFKGYWYTVHGWRCTVDSRIPGK